VEKDNKANIFIIDDSFNNEEKVAQIMRNSGYSAHITRVEDEEDLSEALQKKQPNLLLYSMGMELISLSETLSFLNKNCPLSIPVIALQKSDDSHNIVDIMRTGAKDLSSLDNSDHLELVIKRELYAQYTARQLLHLQNINSETEKRCASLLDSSRDAIAYIHEGMHVYSNSSYLELFKFEESEDLEGMPILDMVDMEDRDKFKEFLRQYDNQTQKTESSFELNLRDSNDNLFNGEMEFFPANIDGEPCIQVVIRNQLDNAELEKQLLLLSQRDSVTGLYNRQYFMETLEQTVADANSHKVNASVLFIHLDNLSEIRKNISVVGYDQYLHSLSRAMEDAAGENVVLSHFEGNKFTAIILDKTADEIESYAGDIRGLIHDFSTDIEGKSLSSSCCIGITAIDENTPDANEVLLRAERAVDQARELGPNSQITYKPKEGELTQKEIDAKIVDGLKEALTNDRFILYFQPVISLHGDTDERYEVFLRLKDKKGNLILPADFIPAAERTGMSQAIDRWVFLNTITSLTNRWKEGHRCLFFVKLSATSLKDDSLMNWLKEQLKKYNVPKDSLIFEVKESTAVTNLKHTAEISRSLKELNCGFAIDDFGTGKNPFELLKHIPVDYLKLEPSFMSSLSSSVDNQEAVKKITDAATNMNKLTIAQGVEDATSLSVLWGMGINFIQGNFLQEPLPTMEYDFTSMGD